MNLVWLRSPTNSSIYPCLHTIASVGKSILWWVMYRRRGDISELNSLLVGLGPWPQQVQWSHCPICHGHYNRWWSIMAANHGQVRGAQQQGCNLYPPIPSELIKGALWWNFLSPVKSVGKCSGQEMEWGITRRGNALQVNQRCFTLQCPHCTLSTVQCAYCPLWWARCSLWYIIVIYALCSVCNIAMFCTVNKLQPRVQRELIKEGFYEIRRKSTSSTGNCRRPLN